MRSRSLKTESSTLQSSGPAQRIRAERIRAERIRAERIQAERIQAERIEGAERFAGAEPANGGAEPVSGAEHISGVDTPRSRCLTEDEILAFCAGEAGAGTLARFDEHLDRCEMCRTCVAEMAGLEDWTGGDGEGLHPTQFQPGMIVAERFRIVRFIKRGGMGEVYEAFDQVLEIPVALKTVVSTACDSPRAVRKLKAEVQLARSVRHPNVCSVFDFWEHRASGDERGSLCFFTMEFIEGETLGQRLRRERPSVKEVLRLSRLQLLGLSAAHASGVVHRDYKSDNVMLRRGRHDDSEVVVMDFGLARTLHADAASASNDSQHLAGSVAYMAPEQVEGRRHIGTEADIFAFGVVLFEMLTGQLPFSGDSPWTTATRRLTERAPAPSRLAAGIDPALDAFVLRCMSREPEARYPDAAEALEAFDRLLRSGEASRAPRWRAPAAWATAAMAVCVGAVAVAWSQSGGPRVRARSASASPERSLEQIVEPLERAERRPSAAGVRAEPASDSRSPAPTPATPVPAAPTRPPELDRTPAGAMAPAREAQPPTKAAATPARVARRALENPTVASPRPAESARSAKSAPSRSPTKQAPGAPTDALGTPQPAAASVGSPVGPHAAGKEALNKGQPEPAETGAALPDTARPPGAPAKLRGFE